jgi:N-acetylglutamate synthase-like GNAT family acetyltransferase
MRDQGVRRLELYRVRSPLEAEFDALISIYTAALPESERKPVGLLSTMIQKPDYFFGVGTLDGAVVGFCIVHCFSQTDVCLLEYMAITETLQGTGLGTSLLKQALETPEISEKFMLAEVDSDKLQTPDRPSRTRRKEFYRRAGFKEVEFLDYIMPPVSSGKPPAMDLMVGGRHLPREISKAQLQTWLEKIFASIYALPATDARIVRMIGKIPDKLPLI